LNDVNSINAIKSFLNEIKKEAVELKERSFINDCEKIEKKVIKLNTENQSINKKIAKYEYKLIRLRIEMHNFRENGIYSGKRFIRFFTYSMMIFGIAISFFKKNPNVVGDSSSLLFIMGDLVVSCLAGFIGALTYIFSETIKKNNSFVEKLLLSLMFPVILIIIFVDISKGFSFSLSYFICFAVGYNFEVLLLFLNKIMEKIKATIEKI